jgi:CRISPR/Cas system-associated protein endoribonuclease Cas2
MNYLTNDHLKELEFNQQLINLFQQIKQMKLKNCVTLYKAENTTETANIIKKSINKRLTGTNEIVLKMDDFMCWSIGEHNFNEIIINNDSIQLFDTDNMTVTFTK